MKLSLKLLLKVGSFIGRNKLYKSSFMNGFIIGYRKNICIFDVHQTEYMLRRALDFYINIVSNKGKVFFISFSKKYEKNSFLGQEYSKAWVNGNITNIRQLSRYIGGYKMFRFLPSLVLLLQDEKSKYFIMNECFQLKIPMIALMNSDMIPSMTFFPIPSNNVGKKIVLFYRSLFNKAFRLGILKTRINNYYSRGVLNNEYRGFNIERKRNKSKG